MSQTKETDTQASKQLFDARTLVAIAWRGKLFLGAIVLVAAAVTFVICKILPKLYEAHLVMVPASTASRDKQIEEFRYGYEADSERLIQFLNSEVILDSLEKKFELVSAWEIDRDNIAWYDLFLDMAKDRIAFHKTRHSSVVVSVIDEEPERAAAIANDVFRLLNDLNAQIIRKNAKALLESIEHEYDQSLATVSVAEDSISTLQTENSSEAISKLEAERRESERKSVTLRDSIQRIRSRFQIFDYGYQVNILNEQLALAQSEQLQQRGILEVLRKGHAPDSSLRKAESLLLGAENRVTYFQKQLADLSYVNGQYEGLMTRLNAELKMQEKIEYDLSVLNQSIEPLVATRGLSRLESDLKFDRIRLEGLREKYRTAMANYIDPLPMAHLVSPARPSYKAIYPKTLIAMIFAAVGGLILGIFLLMLREGTKAEKVV